MVFTENENMMIERYRGNYFSLSEHMPFSKKEMKHVFEVNEIYISKFLSKATLMEHVLQSKLKKEELSRAFNPSEILFHENTRQRPESGESQEEALFKSAGVSLKDVDALTIVAGSFYNTFRDDSMVEISLLMPFFKELIKQAQKVLVVNPSPHMLFELKKTNRRISYVVEDETIAQLYKMSYERGQFFTFHDVELKKELMTNEASRAYQIKNLYELSQYDLILATARDQKITKIIQTFDLASNGARIVALMPENMLNSKACEFGESMRNNGMCIHGILRLYGSYLKSKPKHKMLMDITVNDRYISHKIPVMQSEYDADSHLLHVQADLQTMSSNNFLSPMKLAQKLKDKNSIPTTKKKYEIKKYSLTHNIELHYSLPGGAREGKFIHIRYIMNHKTIEKNLGLTNSEVIKRFNGDISGDFIKEVEDASINPKILSRIVADLSATYTEHTRKDSVSLFLSFKDLWYLCHEDLLLVSYNDTFAQEMFLFPDQDLARLIPDKALREEIIDAFYKVIPSNAGKGVKYLKTLNTICKMALEKGYITRNPIPELLEVVSHESSIEEREIRIGTVKKVFEPVEEHKMMDYLMLPEGGEVLPKCITSGCWFLVLVRLLTGITLGEAAAIQWGDFQENSAGAACLSITKYADASNKIVYYENENKLRLIRSKEVCIYLAEIIYQRKKYLTENCGVQDETLTKALMLTDFLLSKPQKKQNPRENLRLSCKKLIEQAGITENLLEIPSDNETVTTDVNRYNGDIFRTNFRLKAKLVGYSDGEIDASLGTTAYQPFENNYCDFNNDLSILKRVGKLNRWTNSFFAHSNVEQKFIEFESQTQYVILADGGGDSLSTLDVFASVKHPNATGNLKVNVQSEHGVKGYITAVNEE